MSKDEQSIRRLVADWLDATIAGDVERVLALISPDVVFLVAGQAPMHGRDVFGKALRQLLASYRIESDSAIEEVEVAGDMAYCRTRLAVTLLPDDGSPPLRRSGHTLSVFRRGRDGHWLLTRDANLLTPDQRPVE